MERDSGWFNSCDKFYFSIENPGNNTDLSPTLDKQQMTSYKEKEYLMNIEQLSDLLMQSEAQVLTLGNQEKVYTNWACV